MLYFWVQLTKTIMLIFILRRLLVKPLPVDSSNMSTSLNVLIANVSPSLCNNGLGHAGESPLAVIVLTASISIVGDEHWAVKMPPWTAKEARDLETLKEDD